MRSFYLKFALVFIALFALVGLACFSPSPDPTATPEPPPSEEPTQEVVIQPQPTPTNTVVVDVVEPTEDPEPPMNDVSDEPPAFYTEEFDGDLDGYSYYLERGDESTMDFYLENGRLNVDLESQDQYLYFFYEEYTYSSVAVEITAENRGTNSNSISLVCNYSDKYGWYEFVIQNDGMYAIWANSFLDDGFDMLQSGGSENIRTGRATNTYSAICDGNHLELYINGYYENEVTDNKYNLKDGLVGFSISSFDAIPVIVEVESFTIAETY
ncbi:hypothetical protein KQH62_02300 [bacterium]|nr:hypothetical protein [bacterium]